MCRFYQLYPMKNQKLLSTTILLIIVLVVIPVVAIFYDQPLTVMQMHILMNLVKGMLIVSLVCFVLVEITSNYSQTDK